MTHQNSGDHPVTESLETIVGRLDERVENNAKNMERGFKSLSDQFSDLRQELKRDLSESQKRFDEDHQAKCPGRKAMRIIRREQRAKALPPPAPTPSAGSSSGDPAGWGSTVKYVVGALVGVGIVIGTAYREYSKDPEPKQAISAPAAHPGGSGRQP